MFRHKVKMCTYKNFDFSAEMYEVVRDFCFGNAIQRTRELRL